MSVLRRISENIDQLNQMIRDTEKSLSQSPDDFALKLQLDSYNNQLEELQTQRYRQNLKREKEIVEVRLIGQNARFGSLPLRMVGGLTNAFSQAIFSASKFKMFGNKRNKNKITNETIDLRLEGIGTGSTVFYLSGKTSPDLFGKSVIQETLDNTFNFLNSEGPDDLTDRITDIGTESVKHFSKFMEELHADQLEVDIKWKSPRDTEVQWEGRSEKISEIYKTLSRIEIRSPEEIEFEGDLVTISSKGKFEISTNDNRYSGSFADELLNTMREFHIADRCTGTIEKTVIYNHATTREKTEYSLKTINKSASV